MFRVLTCAASSQFTQGVTRWREPGGYSAWLDYAKHRQGAMLRTGVFVFGATDANSEGTVVFTDQSWNSRSLFPASDLQTW